MTKKHIEFLVEEPSMEAFLYEVLPKIFEDRVTFAIYVHQGKPDLLAKLEKRLCAYAKWLPDNCKIVVLVDRDQDDCVTLKERLEACATAAKLATRTSVDGDSTWQVVNRVAIEELEAWYFGELNGLRKAYPNLPKSLNKKSSFRQCDAIAGGTWEALERVLKRTGYFSGGLRKVEIARAIGVHFDHSACVSPSFGALRLALIEVAHLP